jgi:HEAT repeat protein
VRQAATKALGHIGDGSVVAPLISRLADGSTWVRRSAAYALGAMCARQALLALTAVLEDPDPYVRRNAAWALGRVGDTSALPKLRVLQADTAVDGAVAQAAGTAISAIQQPGWQRLAGKGQRLFVRRGASIP